MTQRRARAPEPLEHESQKAFFEWWEWFSASHKLPTMLCFAVPNGGHRHPAVAGKLKAEGVRSGVPDVFLEIPSSGFHGLRLEFKRKGRRPTPEQKEWLYEARRRGYNAMVVYSTEEAIHIVKAYLRTGTQRPEDSVNS